MDVVQIKKAPTVSFTGGAFPQQRNIYMENIIRKSLPLLG